VARKSSKKLDSLLEQLRSKGTPVMETGHEVWLAGLGALSVAQKKGEKVAGKGSKMFERLVTEGQKVEKRIGKTVRSDAHKVAKEISGAAGEARDQVKKVADKARDEAKKTVDKVRVEAKKTVDSARGQLKKTALKARGQVKKAADKGKDRAKKAVARVMPKRTGPVTLRLLPKDAEWAVRLEGSEDDLSLHPTKHSAVKAARVLARKRSPSHLVVHRADGTVQESFSYD